MEEKYCPKCGKKSPVDAGFCPSCGASFKIERAQVIVVTTPTVPGYQIVKVLGTVHGLTVRTRGIGGKIVAGIEGMFGGEVTSYSSEAEKARRDSLGRLIEKAAKMGANAVVGADFETSDILQGTATLFSAYGTAVIIEPIKK
ncbi:MAG: heavy metal-binding domain-containing protein [Candidatus Bathyarchaeota archaeon]|nr:heavy metal-binding domain-containing protein [Candidatus Bathyarchaeota archaeon]MDH5663673.1 heavy metal-binding domain-containing protein [Candidatus Bathyarchaeota archaeon]